MIETQIDLATLLTPSQLAKAASLDSAGQAKFGKVIKIVASSSVKNYFAQSTSPDGVAWEKLKHREGKPLLLTGHLRTGATTSARIVLAWPKVSYVVDTFYASFQNDGTHTIPARPFLGWSDQGMEDIGAAAVEMLL